MLVPIRNESTVPAPTDSKPNLPGRRPSHLSTASNIRGAIPDWNITSPMIINRGRGSRVKRVTEVRRLRISCSRPISLPQNKYTPMIFTIMKEKATGIPVASKIIRLPKMSKRANCHSNEIHLTV
jgi:hypothetical protein